MKCIKCGQELPEGTKFCTSCGAPQTEVTPVSEKKESACDVIITGYSNLTGAINAVRRVSDASVADARKLLGTLPVRLFTGLGLQQASEIREMLKEYGITVHEDKEPEAQAKAEADAKAAEDIVHEMDAFIKSEEMQNMNLSKPAAEENQTEQPEQADPADEETQPAQSDADFEAEMQAFLNGNS